MTPLLSTRAGASVRSYGLFGGKVYKLGDIGPGGGVVFYDAGSTLSWGRYLEAATSSTSPAWTDQSRNIANSYVSISTSTAIGQGLSNTNNFYANDSSAGLAATYVRAYAGGGFSGSTVGWYIPSRDELTQLYNNRTYVTDLNLALTYSSSSTSNNLVWQRDFSSGSSFQAYWEYGGTIYAIDFRAIRAFS